MTTTTPSSAATSFINIGERTNVTGSVKFRKLIEAAILRRWPVGKSRGGLK